MQQEALIDTVDITTNDEIPDKIQQQRTAFFITYYYVYHINSKD